MSEDEKTPVVTKRKRQIWVWFLIFFILFVYLIIGLNFLDRYMNSKSSDNKSAISETSSTTVPATTPAPASKSTSATKHPAPQACEPSTFNEEPLTPVSADNPGLKFVTEDQYYKIYGWTEADLNNQLIACVLDAGGGQKASAVTMHDITFEFHYDPKDSGMCNIKDVAVATRTDIIYPQWQRPADAEQSATTRWNRYIANTKTHEEGHRKFYTDAGQNVYSTLLSVPDAATCQEARTDADNRAYAIIWKAEADSINYDAATNHGTTQGAVY